MTKASMTLPVPLVPFLEAPRRNTSGRLKNGCFKTVRAEFVVVN
jgi:hypothetical protein